MANDPGQSPPVFMRASVHGVPNSSTTAAKFGLPLGVVVHPLAEVDAAQEVPVVNFGQCGVIRCKRCRS